MKRTILVFTLAISFVAKAQIIHTIAGDGNSGYSGDGGPATLAEFSYPLSLVYNKSGDLFISDPGNNCIRMINKAGVISTVAGNGYTGYSGDGGSATAAMLFNPVGICTDASGNLYIVDYYNYRLRKVNSSGVISTIAGIGSAGYSGDGGAATNAQIHAGAVSVDVYGNIYLADVGNNCVRKINSSGIITTVAGTGTAGYSGDGGPATIAELDSPNQVIVDNAGNLYISDVANNRIRVVNTSGIISTIAGNGVAGLSGDGGPATAAEINAPNGLAIDNSDDLYIADALNNCIRMVSFGTINTIAGNHVQGYSGDGGPATAAELYEPCGIALDSNQFISFADYGNVVVRKIDAHIMSINEVKGTSSIALFPNPSKGKFTIQSTVASGQQSVEIYNMLGEKVYSNLFSIQHSTFNIDISKEPTGVYLYQISSVDGSAIAQGKFVIEK